MRDTVFDPPGRWIPFRYKLALSISGIVAGLVGAVFFIFQDLIEQNAVKEIESDLVSTRQLVAGLIEERRLRLWELANAVGNDDLVRTVLTDRTLDRVTADDIVENEILVNFSQLNLLVVADKEGAVMAGSRLGVRLTPELVRHDAFRAGLVGTASLGYLLQGELFEQLMVLPVFIGSTYARELIGIIVVGMAWTEADLNNIRELSRAEIAFFSGGRPFLSSGFPFGSISEGKVFSAPAAIVFSRIPEDRPDIYQIGSERFLLQRVTPDSKVSPPYVVARSLDSQLASVMRLQRVLLPVGLAGILLGLSVSVLLALGISRPVQLLRQAADRVAGGDYNHPVLIRGRDEFSLLGLAFNRMLDGLREKERMHRDLMLAEEVQRNLLPARIPAGEHFDIAAAGVHCSETGGDYYDFFPGEQTGDGQFHVVVGDVSEHGIAAALLMATARAFLRSRVRQPGALDRIVSDVNRSLCADVGDSGRFMTLFHLAVDSVDRKLEWVRAGHDPALLYDPATDAFEELGGEGLALGVDPLYRYRRYAKQHIASGQIAVIGTDGIWEACNEAGEMFGKERMRRQVRVAAAQEAGMLLNGILRELKDFRGRRELEDDVTLVVVKFK